MKHLEDLKLAGQRALMRVDFNVPLVNGEIQDNFRIKAVLPTIKYCLDQGAAVVLMSHLGRPNGRLDKAYSLEPVARELEILMEEMVQFSDDCIAGGALDISSSLKPGDIHLLENLRFHPEEENNDSVFAAALAEHGTVYVNDAFGTAHRAHASNVAIVPHFNQAGIGYLMEREVKYLKDALKNPRRPYVVVLGGAKIRGKLELLHRFVDSADRILIGGAMAFTFLEAEGKKVGNSLVDRDLLEDAAAILAQARRNGIEVLLPRDVVAAEEVDELAPWRVIPIEELEEDERGVDIGPETCVEFGLALESAKTILWNGPMGVFEITPFSTGTEMIISTLADLTGQGAVSIVGGGDSAAAIAVLSDHTYFTHVSTGGGASLELLSGQVLPALEALGR